MFNVLMIFFVCFLNENEHFVLQYSCSEVDIYLILNSFFICFQTNLASENCFCLLFRFVLKCELNRVEPPDLDTLDRPAWWPDVSI